MRYRHTWGLAVLLVCAGTLAAQTPTGKAGKTPAQAETYVSSVTANIPAAADKPAALVNGEMVSMLEVKALLESRPYPNALNAEEIKACRQAAVDMLVEDLLMQQFLAKYALLVKPADLAREMQTLEEKLKKTHKTVAELCKETGQSPQRLRKSAAMPLQWRAYLNTKLPEAEARKYYEANKPFFDNILVLRQPYPRQGAAHGHPRAEENAAQPGGSDSARDRQRQGALRDRGEALLGV